MARCARHFKAGGQRWHQSQPPVCRSLLNSIFRPTETSDEWCWAVRPNTCLFPPTELLLQERGAFAVASHLTFALLVLELLLQTPKWRAVCLRQRATLEGTL